MVEVSRFHRPPFDPQADFVAAKPFMLHGQMVKVGDPVDKSTIAPRRLRQMYEAARMLRQVEPKKEERPQRYRRRTE